MWMVFVAGLVVLGILSLYVEALAQDWQRWAESGLSGRHKCHILALCRQPHIILTSMPACGGTCAATEHGSSNTICLKMPISIGCWWVAFTLV